jgi:hypothetical protein
LLRPQHADLRASRPGARATDVVEAAIGEGRGVVPLGRRAPVDLAVQAVVVVVAGEALEGGVGQRAEHFTVEDLALEGRPERLDLAVGPRRVDLGADVADLEVAQRLAEARRHPGHPVDEGRQVDCSCQTMCPRREQEKCGSWRVAGSPAAETIALES